MSRVWCRIPVGTVEGAPVGAGSAPSGGAFVAAGVVCREGAGIGFGVDLSVGLSVGLGEG